MLIYDTGESIDRASRVKPVHYTTVGHFHLGYLSGLRGHESLRSAASIAAQADAQTRPRAVTVGVREVKRARFCCWPTSFEAVSDFTAFHAAQLPRLRTAFRAEAAHRPLRTPTISGRRMLAATMTPASRYRRSISSSAPLRFTSPGRCPQNVGTELRPGHTR